MGGAGMMGWEVGISLMAALFILRTTASVCTP